MTTETAAKKDTQRLQRAIVDGLEDVKAQDISVFNTEHLSALFERVIIATGSSNRQTKALAASVRDAVREEGFPKPRTEGEENGEWIIVDCGAAVVHIMQAAIRQYYTLEEIWGDKPVRLKFGATKPAIAAPVAPVKASKAAVAKKETLRRSSAAKTAVKAREQADREEKAATTKRAPSKRVRANTATPKKPSKPPGAIVARPAVATKSVAPAKKAVAKKAAPAKRPATKAAAPRKTAAAKK